jgi:hypothetical protein
MMPRLLRLGPRPLSEEEKSSCDTLNWLRTTRLTGVVNGRGFSSFAAGPQSDMENAMNLAKAEWV